MIVVWRRLLSATLSQSSPPPLKGLKVLDLTRILAGPFATQLLGDYGADVVKVEHPKHGDDTRRWGPPFIDTNGIGEKETTAGSSHCRHFKESCYFIGVNRNKRSLAIDLKSNRGQAIVKKLAEDADVLIHNYLPSKMKEFQLDYETMKKVNPRLIYCEITGWGSSGPRVNEPGYDLVASSVGGFMHITGEPDGPPSKSGVALTDVATGLFAHGAIQAAIISRFSSGVGQKIECSLFESQLGVLVNAAANALLVGDPGRRLGTAHKSIVPYQVFPTRNSHLTVAAMNDKQYNTLANAIGRPDLAEENKFKSNEGRVANREELVEAISTQLQTKTNDEWCQLFDEHATFVSSGMFSFGPINSVTQAFEDKQAVAREMVMSSPHSVLGEIPLVGFPVKFSETHPAVECGPPVLGEHSRVVLKEWLSMSDSEVDKLEQDEVIACWDHCANESSP
eukprot:m.46635 g.46635  ORF g.46635 m.46635 type:complete len:451 (-) comp10730_c0_seq3:625-1977(-)